MIFLLLGIFTIAVVLFIFFHKKQNKIKPTIYTPSNTSAYQQIIPPPGYAATATNYAKSVGNINLANETYNPNSLYAKYKPDSKYINKKPRYIEKSSYDDSIVDEIVTAAAIGAAGALISDALDDSKDDFDSTDNNFFEGGGGDFAGGGADEDW